MSSSDEPPAIGIDLGTTHCCVACINHDGKVDVIANTDGQRTTPSYVLLTDEETLVGQIAKEDVYRQPKNVIYDSKRLIGRRFDDEYMQNDIKHWTFKVKDCSNQPEIEVPLKDKSISYKPQEISAMLLTHMKKVAEDFIGKCVKNAVITVPARFNYLQRTATMEAGRIAGLDVLEIINEPTAAALAYIHKNKIKGAKNILVFDLGGGTLDVSIIEIETKAVNVVATAGNTHLGGRDFDNNLRDLICQKLAKRCGKNILESDLTNRRICQVTEKLKMTLSLKTTAHFDFLYLNGEDMEIEISREEFEEINCELFNSALDVVVHCLSDANLGKGEIDDIVLVGGSTRIPKIQQILTEFFEGKALSKTVNPEEAVAYGAAIQTKKINRTGKEEVPTKIDVTALTLGVEIQGGVMDVLIPRNCTIPVSADQIYYSIKDKQIERYWDIYEGERPFVKDNIYLGRCSLKTPPRPPGYPVKLTFEVDKDGILRINARDESGLHKDLIIVYENHDAQKINDRIQEAKINKPADQKKESIIEKWRLLRNYCTKLKAICDYDKRKMSAEDKDYIKTVVENVICWLDNNKKLNGTKEEEDEIRKKDKRIKDICEPLAKTYGYDVRNISWGEFYKIVT